MIYLGNSWPKEYRNDIFMNNINGARLTEHISSYRLRPATRATSATDTFAPHSSTTLPV